MKIYDVAVIGLGGMGSAVAAQLANQGARVLGLEQFPPVHDRGSSHGRTRIIRETYFEHPHYVPLVREAFSLWKEVEERSGRTLLTTTGLLQVGPHDSSVVQGILRSASEHNIPIETFATSELADRFPQFTGTDDWTCVFERRAGCLEVEPAIETFIQLAKEQGGELHFESPLLSYQPSGAEIELTTKTETFRAKKVVFATGGWTGKILQELGIPLEILMKFVCWFDNAPAALSITNQCPVFLYETDQGCFYGFPSRPGEGLKLAEHSGGIPVSNSNYFSPAASAADHSAPPIEIEQLELDDQSRLEAFARTCLLANELKLRKRQSCYYTMTPDGHFIIDRLPENDQLYVMSGFSGHGFKFLPVFGKLVSDAVLHDRWDSRLSFLSLDRFRDR